VKSRLSVALLTLTVFYVLLLTCAWAQTNPSCAYFTVVARDKLNNIKEGLSADDLKWFQKKFAKKYPEVCYADPHRAVPIVFYISVTPDTYHGTRVVDNTSTHSGPVTGTVTDQNGDTSQLNGTVQTTTTSSTAVPYSFEYGIFTLSVESRRRDGKFDVVHTFQQKGIYHTLYGIPLGGKGHHPAHAVIEDAVKWVSDGGLTHATAVTVAGQDEATPPRTAAPTPPALRAIAAVKISVVSVPDGADIEVDGSFVGNTPSDIQVTEGDHAVALKKTGFKDWERKLKVSGGSSVHLNAELEKVASQ
jgi:PEGA domain-containing protein